MPIQTLRKIAIVWKKIWYSQYQCIFITFFYIAKKSMEQNNTEKKIMIKYLTIPIVVVVVVVPIIGD